MPLITEGALTENSVKPELTDLRNRALAELVALASDQAEAKRLLSKINRFELLIAEETEDQPPPLSLNEYPYVGYKRATDPIMDFLKEKGRSASKDELIDVLSLRGFRGGNRKQVETLVGQALGAKRQKSVRFLNGEWGLWGWRDDRFPPNA